MKERLEKIEARCEALGWDIQREGILYVIAVTYKNGSSGPVIHFAHLISDDCDVIERMMIPYEEDQAREAKAKTLEEIRSKLAATTRLKGRAWELVEAFYRCPHTGGISDYALTVFSQHLPSKHAENDLASGILSPLIGSTIRSTIHFNEDSVDSMIRQFQAEVRDE